MTSAEFKPQFDPTVGVIGPSNSGTPSFTPINPKYCASPQCATDLASVLADLSPQIVSMPPFGIWPGGQWAQTKSVPWFKFAGESGDVFANVGQLAAYWTHGFPPAYAEQQCRGDIALLLRGM